MNLFTESATVRDRAVIGEDQYGNDVYSWTSRTVAAWWEPRTSGEQTDAREQVTDGYWLYLEPGDPIAASSQVALTADADPTDEGVAWYEVDGRPGHQPSGFFVDGYVRAALTLVTG